MYTINTKDQIVSISSDFKNILLYLKNNAIIKKGGIAYRFNKTILIDDQVYERTFQNKDVMIYEKRDSNVY